MCEQNCKQCIKNKDYLKNYYQSHKEDLLNRNKQYYYDHREESLAYKKEYIQKNKEKLDKIAKQRYDCSECNGSYTYSNKSKHLLSKKHLNSIKPILDNDEPSNESIIN